MQVWNQNIEPNIKPNINPKYWTQYLNPILNTIFNSNIEPNIEPDIEAKLNPNIKPNIEPNIECNIEYNIEPQYWTPWIIINQAQLIFPSVALLAWACFLLTAGSIQKGRWRKSLDSLKFKDSFGVKFPFKATYSDGLVVCYARY